MSVSPQNSHIEVLIPNMVVFGGEACAKWFSLDEVLRVRPSRGDECPYKKRYERDVFLSLAAT
jgi:hypothetical protein